MIDFSADRMTGIGWEKMGPSQDGISQYRAWSWYDGHKMTHVFHATDELAGDRKAMRAYIKAISCDFVKDNPPA